MTDKCVSFSLNPKSLLMITQEFWSAFVGFVGKHLNCFQLQTFSNKIKFIAIE